MIFDFLKEPTLLQSLIFCVNYRIFTLPIITFDTETMHGFVITYVNIQEQRNGIRFDHWFTPAATAANGMQLVVAHPPRNLTQFTKYEHKPGVIYYLTEMEIDYVAINVTAATEIIPSNVIDAIQRQGSLR